MVPEIDDGAQQASPGAVEAGLEALPGAAHDAGHSGAPGQGSTAVDFPAGMGGRLRSLAIGAAVVLALAFVLVWFLKSRDQSALAVETRQEAGRPVPVSVVSVKADAGDKTLELPGETAAWFESTIYGRVNGYVARWYSDIGDRVRQGQLLATIDTPELDAQLVAARAQLNAAQAQVRVRQAEAELATTTYARWRDSPKGVVSEQEREEKKADFDAAEARLNASRAQVAVNQADVDRYTALTEFKRVVAPFEGTIIERRIDIGNLVTAGSTASTTPLYRISQDAPIRVFVDVPQRVAGDLMRKGMAAKIRLSSAPGRSYTGTITRSAMAINPQARTMKVEVDLPNTDQSLVAGMYVDVVFGLPTRSLVQVPAAAMVFRASGPQVAVVDREGRVRFRAVSIARDDGSVVELGSGVDEGEKVALNISSQIADGQLVDPRESAPAASAVGALSAPGAAGAPSEAAAAAKGGAATGGAAKISP